MRDDGSFGAMATSFANHMSIHIHIHGVNVLTHQHETCKPCKRLWRMMAAPAAVSGRTNGWAHRWLFIVVLPTALALRAIDIDPVAGTGQAGSCTPPFLCLPPCPLHTVGNGCAPQDPYRVEPSCASP